MPLISNTPADNRQSLYKQERQYIDPRGRITQSDRWYSAHSNDSKIIVSGHGVLDTLTGERYRSATQASEETGFNLGSILKHVNGNIKNPRFVRDENDRKEKKIFDNHTGEIYKSLHDCCTKTGFLKRSIEKHLHKRIPNCRYEYYDGKNQIKPGKKRGRP